MHSRKTILVITTISRVKWDYEILYYIKLQILYEKASAYRNMIYSLGDFLQSTVFALVTYAAANTTVTVA